jgi:cellulose synthase/poly-beta-1,6-N-acetylglucosamine synthase-like glycosyltransferase
MASVAVAPDERIELAGDADWLPVTVVICAYTERRWDQIRAAVESAVGQRPPPAQVLLVVDHNTALAARARRELGGVTVLDSDGAPGLSGARNSGLRAATQPVTAFLDDDAQARPGWLAALAEPYRSPAVVATGGSVYPRWPGPRPRWLPPAFDWVVGCSYLGLPDTPGPVRNPIGANMSVRTEPTLAAGGFDAAVGRVGTLPTGCEETELAIRLTAGRPAATVWYVPAAAVDHHVAPERVRVGYFIRRCWHEGRSKALVVELAGASAGLARERRHAARVIPAAMVADLRRLVTGDPSALLRVLAAAGGLAAAGAGYCHGRARLAGARKGHSARPIG